MGNRMSHTTPKTPVGQVGQVGQVRRFSPCHTCPTTPPLKGWCGGGADAAFQRRIPRWGKSCGGRQVLFHERKAREDRNLPGLNWRQLRSSNIANARTAPNMPLRPLETMNEVTIGVLFARSGARPGHTQIVRDMSGLSGPFEGCGADYFEEKEAREGADLPGRKLALEAAAPPPPSLARQTLCRTCLAEL